ncbi:hypothetical protein HAX54_018730, partial [Datura stramonium]|nr:hypothetical protein [Datura stramonium]
NTSATVPPKSLLTSRQLPLPAAVTTHQSTALRHYGTTIRQSPLKSRQPRLLSIDRPSPSAVGNPHFPNSHRSAIALASKQRVVTRQSSLSLISARLPTLCLCRLLQSSTAPPPGSTSGHRRLHHSARTSSPQQ